MLESIKKPSAFRIKYAGKQFLKEMHDVAYIVDSVDGFVISLLRPQCILCSDGVQGKRLYYIPQQCDSRSVIGNNNVLCGVTVTDEVDLTAITYETLVEYISTWVSIFFYIQNQEETKKGLVSPCFVSLQLPYQIESWLERILSRLPRRWADLSFVRIDELRRLELAQRFSTLTSY